AGSPFQSSVSQVNSTSIIDAYGTAKIPGGKTINVLRIKRDDRTYTKNSSGQGDTYSRVISYMFYSKTGDYVSVVVGDTTQPDHGEVVAINVGWNQYAATAVNEKTATVTTFELEQNYPNPFNPSTSIKYSIAADSFVELKVFDSIGKEVKTLVSQNQGRGQYSVAFSADDLPSGVYVARLKAGSYTKSVKMLLMK
ncbi:MAG: T9SS type A sorting domain-containing protein, partial [Bacillota bacterium]